MALAYFETMSNQKPTIVMLHGWGAHSGVWQPISEPLSKVANLVPIDMPGFGQGKMLKDYSLEAIVEEVVNQAPDNAIWLGWSLGGLIATKVALTYPARVARVITVASSPCFEEKNDWFGMSSLQLNKFSDQLNHDFQKTMKRFLGLQFHGLEVNKGLLRQLERELLEPCPDPAALIGGLAILKNIDLRGELSRLACPMTAYFGRLDAIVPVACAEQIKAFNSSVKTVIFDRDSHAPFISHPEEFIQELSFEL